MRIHATVYGGIIKNLVTCLLVKKCFETPIPRPKRSAVHFSSWLLDDPSDGLSP